MAANNPAYEDVRSFIMIDFIHVQTPTKNPDSCSKAPLALCPLLPPLLDTMPKSGHLELYISNKGTQCYLSLPFSQSP